MPVHASVPGAVAASAREAAMGSAGGAPAIGGALSHAGAGAEGDVDLLTVSVSARRVTRW